MEIPEISKSPKDVKKGVHSVKSILFLSARQRNFDGMLGTGLPVSMYTMKPSFLNAKLGYKIQRTKNKFGLATKICLFSIIGIQ
jgi:hypothetical protein